MSENPDTPVYGSGGAPDAAQQGLTRVTRLHHLAEMKAAGEPWPMLTAYDFVSAQLFQEAGIPVLLVGDSAANVVYGYDTTVPVTEDEMIPLVRAVTRGARHEFRTDGGRAGCVGARDRVRRVGTARVS